MKVEEVVRKVHVRAGGRLQSFESVDSSGRMVVPYDVVVLAKDSIRNKDAIKYLLIPETVETLESGALDGCRHVLGVAIYSAGDDPATMEVADGVCDLSCVKRFESFPHLGDPLVVSHFKEVIVSADAEIGDTSRGCDAPIRVVGSGPLSASVGGVLYADAGKTLALFPPSSRRTKRFVTPDSVTRIAKGAFLGANVAEVELGPNIEQVCSEAFSYSQIESLIISPGINSFSSEKVGLWDYTAFVESKTVPRSAFVQSIGLERVAFVEGVTEIPDGMFYGCGHLAKVCLPESLVSIGRSAFEFCGALSLVVPNRVESIAVDAFYGTKSVSLPHPFVGDFDRYLAASRGTVVMVAGDGGAGVARAGFAPSKGNVAGAVADEIFDGVGCQRQVAIDARFHDGSIRRFADKIRVALTRLVDPENPPSEAMEAEYLEYVRRNAKKATKAFAEEGDVVCSRLLRELGFASETVVRGARNGRSEPTVAQLTKAALKAMRKGNPSGLSALEPVASKVDPVDAVRLLKYCAMSGDAGTVERLYLMFDKFEMSSIALSYALALGNDSVARSLLGRGVTLGMAMDLAPQGGGTAQMQYRRLKRYLGEVLLEDAYSIPDRALVTYWGSPGNVYLCALSSKSGKLIGEYAEEGLLCGADLKGLMLACLAESDTFYKHGKSRPRLAKLLASAGGLNGERVKIEVMRKEAGRQLEHAVIFDPADALYLGCSAATVRAVCAIAPECAPGKWDARLLKRDPEVVRAFVPHLDPSRFKNTAVLLNVLARNGFDAEARIVCGWEGKVTEKMLQGAIETASMEGMASTAALLMEAKNRKFGMPSPKSLEL